MFIPRSIHPSRKYEHETKLPAQKPFPVPLRSISFLGFSHANWLGLLPPSPWIFSDHSSDDEAEVVSYYNGIHLLKYFNLPFVSSPDEIGTIPEKELLESAFGEFVLSNTFHPRMVEQAVLLGYFPMSVPHIFPVFSLALKYHKFRSILDLREFVPKKISQEGFQKILFFDEQSLYEVCSINCRATWPQLALPTSHSFFLPHIPTRWKVFHPSCFLRSLEK